jgi:putative hydrolase of HD superfamily
MEKEPQKMFDESIKFLRLLRGLEKIERSIYRPDDRRENDVEHSYQVTMLGWFLCNRFRLTLSTEKILKYGLVHDLVEVYAGDTPVYNTKNSSNTVETKQAREKIAFLRIKEEFHLDDEFVCAIDNYEKRLDEESVFIYEVDKFVPMFNQYID